MNTLLLTVFMTLNPQYAGPNWQNSPAMKRAISMDQVKYNHFNYNFQVSIKLRFDGKKRRDGMRIIF